MAGVRNVERLTDAANQLGVERLLALISSEGLPAIQVAMAQVQEQAAEAVRRVLEREQSVLLAA